MTTFGFEPLEDRVVVLPDDPEEIRGSGLIIPQNAQEKPQQGVVLAVGPGRVLQNGDVYNFGLFPGDVVIYSKYGGAEIELDGQKVLILKIADIMMRVQKTQRTETTSFSAEKISST